VIVPVPVMLPSDTVVVVPVPAMLPSDAVVIVPVQVMLPPDTVVMRLHYFWGHIIRSDVQMQTLKLHHFSEHVGCMLHVCVVLDESRSDIKY
jgi:hypothetical protein